MSRILVGFEFSGVVRDEFRKRGHDAWSCDLRDTTSYEPIRLASECSDCECCGEAWCEKHEMHYADCPCIGPHAEEFLFHKDGVRAAAHIRGDVLKHLDDGWDMAIFFPPCTNLTCSGLHRNKDNPKRQARTEEALKMIRLLLNVKIPKVALENPVGCISSRIRQPDQIIQPYQFGHNASKKTCLWLKNLPKLVATEMIMPRMVDGKPRWSNQLDSGQPRGDSTWQRARDRSITFRGIAEAMADQWS